LSKKTTQIIIDSQNDYLVTVKKNQKKLYELLELKRQRTQPVDVSISSELSRDRTIKRTVEFFDDLSCINQEYWRGVKSFICLTRKGQRGGKAFEEKVFYLSSLCLSAEEFGQRIREHWLIENQLHWLKDVLLEEDKSKIKAGMAAQNFSIVRSIVLNLFRKNGYSSPTKTQRMFSNNINYLLLCLE
jgi:predicted transposase YbfD/YdcC